MKMTKLAAALAVAGALTVSATVAMAAGDFTAEYSEGKVKVSGIADYVKAVNGDLTLLVLDEDATTVSEDIIIQIDQGAFKDNAEFTVGDLEDGTYYVRIGGAEAGETYEKGFIASSFDVSSNPWSKCTRLIGNANDDAVVNVMDLAPVANHAGKKAALSGEKLQAADTNDDGIVNIMDFSPIANFTGKKASPVDGVKMVKDKTNFVPEN